MELLFWLVILPLSTIPAIVAVHRKCKNLVLIDLLSFFLGWTVIGGIVALIWAFVGETAAQPAPKSN
jgi:hypothetical protein